MSSRHFVVRKGCPACKSTSFRTLFQASYLIEPIRTYLKCFYSPQGTIELDYLERADYWLCECQDCHLIFQKEVPGKALQRRLYGSWIDPARSLAARNEDGLERFAGYAREIQRLIAFLDKKPFELKILDFGMGWGQWALMAKAFGCRIAGFDPSEHRQRHARSLGIEVLDWEQIRQERFDFINTEQVLEHVLEPLDVVRELASVLNSGGILKISVPTANDLQRRLRIMDWNARKHSPNSLNPVAPLEHINFFRNKSLELMTRSAELSEVFVPGLSQSRVETALRTAKSLLKLRVFPGQRGFGDRRNYAFYRGTGLS